jgi:hypothetical protein
MSVGGVDATDVFKRSHSKWKEYLSGDEMAELRVGRVIPELEQGDKIVASHIALFGFVYVLDGTFS